MPLQHTIRFVFAVALALGIASCDERKPPPTPAEAIALRPKDARLAHLYEQSCLICHTRPDTGAPMVHDHDAWDPRWDQGLDTLTQHAVQGYRAMPAGGQCATCTLEDYRALIRFLADREDGT